MSDAALPAALLACVLLQVATIWAMVGEMDRRNDALRQRIEWLEMVDAARVDAAQVGAINPYASAEDLALALHLLRIEADR